MWYWAGKPTVVKPGVVRCFDCERTHCYAVRGEFSGKLVESWSGGGRFNGSVHCDWIMGRDPNLQRKHKVYAPELFLVGQEGRKSDVNGRVTPKAFWNPPSPRLTVINLDAPQPVVAALREYGFHTGYDRDLVSDLDNGLKRILDEKDGKSSERETRLRDWIKVIQWEVASDPRLICTVWHPRADKGLVKAASPWPVHEVTANSVRAALKQLPSELRRPRMPGLAGERFEPAPPIPNTQFFDLPIVYAGSPNCAPVVPTGAALAANFNKAMLGWAKAGFKVVKREVYEHRQAICSACEFWRPDARLGTGMCIKCGCSGVKLWLATSKCPDQPARW